MMRDVLHHKEKRALCLDEVLKRQSIILLLMDSFIAVFFLET